MIQVALSFALLAPRNSVAQDLSSFFPAEVDMVATIGDLGSALSLPFEERGDWLRMLSDPRVMGPLAAVTADDADVELEPMLGCIKGGAIAAIDLKNGPGLAVLAVDEDFESHYLKIIEEVGGELFETEVLGIPAHIDHLTEDPRFIMMEVEGLTLMVVGNRGTVTEGLEDLVNAVKAGGSSQGWWRQVDKRLTEPLASLHLRLAEVPIDDEEFERLASTVESLHFGIDAGAGKQGGLSVRAAFAESDMIKAVAGCMGRADPSLLGFAPAGTLLGGVMNVDLQRLLPIAGNFLRSLGVGGFEHSYARALAGAEAALGGDLEARFLGNLSGDVFAFECIPDLSLLLKQDRAAVLDAVPTVGFRIKDAQPFVEFLEVLQPLTLEMGGELKYKAPGATLSFSPLPNAEVRVKVTRDFLVAGANAPRFDEVSSLVGRRGEAGTGGAFAGRQLQLAKDALGGSIIGLFDMARLTSPLSAWLADPANSGFSGEVAGVLGAFADHVKGTGLMDLQLSESKITLRFMTR